MNVTARSILCLLTLIWLHPVYCADAVFGSYSECIKEPVFEGKVCTVQANRDAGIGVILIHGLGGSVDDWKGTIPALAANFHVLAFDLPGFGKSDKGSQDYSPTRYAHLAHFLADHYFPDKPYYIVGHSMGGAIALRFAALQPLRFQRLVLIDVAGILHPLVISKFAAGSLVERESGVPQTRGFTERMSGKILEQADKLPVSPIDIANSALGREYVFQGNPQQIAAFELAGEDFSSAIASVTQPSLIVWGENDLTVPLRTGEVLAARMQHARLELIADSGHVPMQDQSAKLNNLVASYLLASDQDLAEQFHPDVQPLFAGKRVGKCSGESGKVFEGDYLSIDLRECSNITIRNARVGALTVVNSQLDLIDTDIVGKKVGLHADNSDITITNGDISGVIAIKSEDSRLDIAGAHVSGSRDAVRGVNSKLVFSVCEVHSPHVNGYFHTYKKLIDGEL